MLDDIEDAWEELRRSLGGRGRFKDLSGARFGRLVAREKIGSIQGGSALWLCDCDCGGIKEASRADLRKGRVKSCGCWMEENQKKKSR